MRVAFALIASLLSGCILMDGLSGAYETVPVVDLDAACEEQPEQTCDATWSATYSNGNTTEVGGLVVSVQSTVYVVGAYAGAITFGLGQLEATNTDAFIVAFDSDGQALSATGTEGSGDERARAVAADAEVVVVAGTYARGFIECGDDAGDAGVFVAVADPGGLGLSALTCVQMTGTFDVSGVAIDRSGLARVAGSFGGDVDGFILSFDKHTAEQRGEMIVLGGEGEQSIDAIVALDDGFAIGGAFEETMTIGPEGYDATDGADAFVAAFDDAGALLQLRQWGGEEDQQVGALATRDGRLYVAGEIDSGEIDFGGGVVVSAPDGDRVGGFVVALQAEGLGDPAWAVSLGAEDMDLVALAASGGDSGAIYAGGTVHGALFTGDAPPVPGSCADVFVVRLDRDTGAHSQTTRCGDRAEQHLVGLSATEDDDDVYFVGDVRGSLDLGGLQQHQAQGEVDILVAQLRPPK